MFKSEDPDTPLLAMVKNMLKKMPLRILIMMSNGSMNPATLKALLLMINGKNLRGLSAR